MHTLFDDNHMKLSFIKIYACKLVFAFKSCGFLDTSFKIASLNLLLALAS